MNAVCFYYTNASGEKVGKSNYTETTYTTDGNYVSSATDDRGNTISTNLYDAKGNPIRYFDGNGNLTKYEYNADNDRITAVKAIDKDNTASIIAQNAYTYEHEQLSRITAGMGTDTVQYSFGYDAYGNQKTVHVGNQNLITNTYAANNGNLTGSTYGNGDTVSYTYDAYDRVTGVRYEGDTSDRYTYVYDAEGKLAKTVDNENNKTYTYVYDIIGRPVSVNCSDGTKIRYVFDNYNKSTKTSYQIGGVTRSVSYTYNENKDNVLDKTTFANSAQYQYVYNDYGQVTATNLTRGTLSWQNAYGFINPGSDRYSNIVSTIYFPNYGASGKRLRYRYDTQGNIGQIADGNGSSTFDNADVVVTYTYDQLNQLKSEVNGYTGETVNYTYDARGNILSKAVTKNGTTDTINYTYGDSNWKDKLTAYDGKAITYDEIGNPLTYDGWNFTWQKGRQLVGMSNTNTALAFTYNNDGIRTSKTVNGTTTEYYYDESTLIGQKTGTQIIQFHYDGNGTCVYMEVRDETTGTTQGYYYVYNKQGDVIALYDNTGAVVAEYTYDTWGKVVNISGNTTVGNLNPFRYRSYYYDNETGLYYTTSRYYHPEFCRFINVDSIMSGEGKSVQGFNLFVYCNNNPANLSDETGNWPKWATKVLIGVAVVAVCAAVAVATGGVGAGPLVAAIHCVAVGAVKGAVIGAAIGAAQGAASGAVSHRLKTGSWKGSGKAALESGADGFMTGAVTGAITGGMKGNICFVAGTSILTSAGHIAIENIRAGDMVWSENPETGEKTLKEVVQTFVNETDELVHVNVDGEEIITTPEHPFYVPGKGWTGAIHLRAGDILLLQSGKCVIVEQIQHEILEAPIKVYNFEVADFHTYYVSDSSVLVHNVCVKSKAKKIDPIKFESDYGLDAGTFHRQIKPSILSKVKPNYQVGKNPDILLDKAKNIAYQGTNGRGFQDTGLNMIDIFKELK